MPGGDRPLRLDASDQVGAATSALQPLHALIAAHVLAAERLHGDDTTVPILAKGKTTRPIWTYVRDDRPFGGSDPPHPVLCLKDRRQSIPRATSGVAGHPAGRCLWRLQRAL